MAFTEIKPFFDGGIVMSQSLNTARFVCTGSPFFISEEIAKTEDRLREKQLSFDLPRTEPRHTEEAADSEPTDFRDHDAIKDGDFRAADPSENGILFLRPFADGHSVPFTAAAESDTLTVRADGGTLECRFEDPETLRIRGTGIGLRFFAPLLDHEAAIDRQDGTFQLDIEAACEFLFVPLKGEAIMDNPWELWHGGTRKLLLTVSPDEDGSLDMAVHMAPSSCERRETYLPFEACTAGSVVNHVPETPSTSVPASVSSPGDPFAAETAPEGASEDLTRRPLLPIPDREKILLSSTGKYDLRSVPFSRRGSFLCIPENDEDRCLYLSVTRSPEMWAQRLHLIRMVPLLGHAELPYEYEVEPGRLMIRTCAGILECCFDAGGRLHLRGSGIRLRLEAEIHPSESCISREQGAWEASFDVLGKVLFAPVTGALVHESSGSGRISLTAGSPEEGAFEFTVESSYASVPVPDRSVSFEDSVRDAEADFERFRKRFPVLPETYRKLSVLAAWTIWIHTLGPSGKLKNPVVYMTRSQWIRAFSWQQSFQAMAAGNDLHEAWRLLLTAYDYADRAGQLPDSVGDLGGTYRVTKPALQGLALLYLTARRDLSALTQEEYEALYTRMTRAVRWWLTFRDRNHSGLPQYFHADESPGEFCDVFHLGVPLYAADVASFVALTAEACGKLAGMLGRDSEAAEWYSASRKIIQKMIDRLWDGNRFQARLAKTGEIVESRCALSLLPIMLGDRLPRDILDRLIARLLDEQEYLAPYGIAVDGPEGGEPLQGTVVYLSTLFCVALNLAGETEKARIIAARVMDLMMEKGFCFLDIRQESDPIANAAGNMPRVKAPAPAAKWTSWTCACFFILGDMIGRQQ